MLQAQAQSEAWEAQRDSRAHALRAEVLSAAQQLQRAQQQLATAAQQLQIWLEAAEGASAELAAELAEQEAQQAQQLVGFGGNGAGKRAGASVVELGAAAAVGPPEEFAAQQAAQQAQRAAQQAQRAVQDAQYGLGMARHRVEERRKALSEYQALGGQLLPGQGLGHVADHGAADHNHQHDHSSSGSGALCDRCLQPIDLGLFSRNVDRMQVLIFSCCPVLGHNWRHRLACGRRRWQGWERGT